MGAASVLTVALAVEPRLFDVEQVLGPAQMVSFRGVLALVLGVLALIIGGLCFAVTKLRVPLVVMLSVLLAGSIWNLGVVLDRGIAAASASDQRDTEVEDSGSDRSHASLTILAWNTQGGGASAAQIAGVIVDHGVDAAMFPETTPEVASEVAMLLADAGLEYSWDVTDGGMGRGSTPTALVVSAELGEYHHDADAGSTPRLPSGVWRTDDPALPAFVAVHAAPPLPEMMHEWRGGLSWAAHQCGPDVVMAGDFNSTIDHWADYRETESGGQLGACVDSAAAVGSAADGTWPTGVPSVLGAPIDHVLTGAHWETTSFVVLADEQAARSDHRPVVAEIIRAR
ncbi:endonuclease/exonuclease/phosphatase family protein [Nesterenkonia sp. Act20]|uniref:endonuclease/exonuclease/phosphatase family protein n=1 Tax=Nesterenkonia sp. Act20 TaxID=1483432 RepID=UPI001C48223B